MNAYEVKAGIGVIVHLYSLQVVVGGKTVLSMPERFARRPTIKRALYTYTYLMHSIARQNQLTGNHMCVKVMRLTRSSYGLYIESCR